MPQKRIIITLNNDESHPEDVRMHVDVEEQGQDKTDADVVLTESAIHMCNIIVEHILDAGEEELPTLKPQSTTQGSA